MWTLRKTTSEAKYFLPCNKNTVIGRKDVDVTITGDSSVSRKHSFISIQHDPLNLKYADRIPIVTVTDTSKFGTFILRPGNEKLRINSTMVIRSGDIIQFGAQTSLYEIRYEPLVVATSIPNNEALKIKLQKTLLQLGGHLVSNWHSTVTHVVTEKIKLSVKITQALVNCCHIVTPEFLFKLEDVLGKCSVNALEPEKFMPEVGEPNLRKEFCSFNINKKRKSVFENRLFIFMCKKQLKRLGPSISGGNGDTRIWSADDNSSDLDNKKTVFVDFNPHNKDSVVTGSQYQDIQDALIKQKRRFIQEHEIGLAILYSDASVYCNTAFDLDSQVALSQCHGTQATAEQEDAEALEVPDAVIKTEQTSGHEAKDQCNLVEYLPSTSTNSKPLTHITKDWVTPDINSDSCLDDDSLWSQNCETMANTGDMQHGTICGSTNLKKTIPRNISNASTDPDGHQKVADVAPAIKLEGDYPGFMSSESPTAKKFKKKTDSSPDKKIPDSGLMSSESPTAKRFEKKTDSSPDKKMPDSGKNLNHNFVRDLPTNVAVIGIKSLIANKRKKPNDSGFTNLNIKNFKIFKKVWPAYMGASQDTSKFTPSHVPHIIGSSDLYVNVDDSDRGNVMGKWLYQPSADSGLFT